MNRTTRPRSAQAGTPRPGTGATKDLFFLGGLGVPSFVFAPWFALLRWYGFRVRTVPNSFATMDPVSTFAESFVRFSKPFERFDVLGVSYGGTAALYGVHLEPGLNSRIRKMVLVCAPLLGVPLLALPVARYAPGTLRTILEEMSPTSEVVDRIRRLGMDRKIAFELHCLYHPKDLMAPSSTATLPGAGVDHTLDFTWRVVPRCLMHQAACVNPKTFATVLALLR